MVEETNMREAARLLEGWDSFYVLVGSSAAALTGLQFVVIALVAETRRRGSAHEFDAFATPTIVHFGAVLILSAILLAPWPSLWGTTVALTIGALAAVAYTILVVRRARKQTGYQMVKEDWIFHAFLPFVAYGALLAAAVSMPRDAPVSLFVIASAALLLMCVGIHNAWDTVTYIALETIQTREPPAEPNG
jgi:hypothetical protein